MKDKATNKHLAQDPYAQREASNYARPIPSREYILQFFAEQDRLMTRAELARALNLKDEEELEGLRRRLIAMTRDGQLFCNRNGAYGPIDKFDLERGRVDSHPDGFGFLYPDDGSEKMFLSFREMRSLMHGDRILVRVAGVDRRGRREGALVEVLERNVKQVVGRFFIEHNISFVSPDNKKMHQDILIPPEARHQAEHGQIVLARIVEYPTRRSQAIGEIVQILGDHMAPGMEIDIAIHAHGLPLEWPEEVIEQTRRIGTEVRPGQIEGRKDLRQLPFVTIDGEDARDFDDAVYCAPTKKGWTLWVAIADVSAYVDVGSALDREAYARGNSVYFPERVIPMLPEALSNGLCSLNPEVDRLVMVCEMSLDKQGSVYRHRFYEAVIHSHARLTYDQVAAALYQGQQSPACRELMEPLRQLDAVYRALSQARVRRGAIDFETTETRILFGPDKKIERIVPVERNDAHRIIEECMIAANVCAAHYLLKHKIPTLFRVHAPPEQDRLADLKDFLGPFGLTLGGGQKPQAKDFASLLNKVKDRPDAHLIQTVLLRTMQQAVYSPENIGHFGLAHKAYAHFTSPIRRYPDLLVHRALKFAIARGRAEQFAYTQVQMQELGEHCSMTERRADEATRDVLAWLKCEFMLDKVGEQFNGIVSSVTSFGLFVELEQIYVEGLVHITTLGDDYFHFDPVSHGLYGERTGKSFRLGDKVRVELVNVNLDERKIDFELIETIL